MSYTFLRWVRFGVAAALNDSILEPGGGPRARITVGVDVGGTGLSTKTTSLGIDVLGPADVAGIDQRQVVRTFPVPGTLDFESSFLAHIEVDRPDLPWLFTPHAHDASGALRPWMCLVVVEKRDGVSVEANTPLPRLKIADGASSELPHLADAHLWAHVQVAGDLDAAVDDIARSQPHRIIARMICPRVLEQAKSYYACVVPTFKVGVDSGLGHEVATDASLDPAWTTTPAIASIELPVYYHWEFATGTSGDFKSLVTRLQGRTELDGVGTRTLDISTPGFGVEHSRKPTTVDLGGALCVTNPAAPPINVPLADQLTTALGGDGLTPPIYGRWHAGSTSLARRTRAIGWLQALNLDPRYRVAAGLGTLVVQQRQEDLMAAVWEQFGEILRANQLLRQAQLAIAASERVVGRHLATLPDADLLEVAGPAFGRIAIGPQRTARQAVAESCAPVIAFSGAFRRIVRTRGPLGRRFTRIASPGFSDLMHPPAVKPATLIASLAAGSWNVKRPSIPDGAIAVPASVVPTKPVRPPVGGPNNSDALGDLPAAFARLARFDRPSTCAPLGVSTLATQVRHAITPDVAIPPRVRAQISLPNNPRLLLSDRLDPVMAAPEIPTPMIGPLQELGQDWLLPGLGDVPPNIVSIVQPNTAFIEAYMVGLNHEMGREMLWRGFPTDQRGTVFSQFWDRRGAAASGGTPLPERDLPAIASWTSRQTLGSHIDSGTGGGLILLVRGDLLVRYPRPTIFMQRARWKRDSQNAIVTVGNLAVREPMPLPDQNAWDAHVRFPSLNGRAGSDVMFLGFPLARTDVHGLDRTNLPTTATDADAGWFVVFQEQHTEPRFGFSTTPPALPSSVSRSEDVAAALLRPAFRLFVHASDLVGA